MPDHLCPSCKAGKHGGHQYDYLRRTESNQHVVTLCQCRCRNLTHKARLALEGEG